MTAATTNALRQLAEAGVAYEVLTYDLADDEFSAEAVADQIGLPHDQVFKTLVVLADDRPVLAVVPAGAGLDLKRLAAHAGARRAVLAPLSDVQRLTGYPRGAVTALGDRRHPVVIDEIASVHDRIAVSAGAMGLQVLLGLDDYLEVTGGELADICR